MPLAFSPRKKSVVSKILKRAPTVGPSVLKHRLPAIYPYRFNVISGGLMSYGAGPVDQYRQAALYVDRILRGAQPGDLPVEQLTRFELVINLKTAKAFGLDVPLALRRQADEVIE